VRNPYNRTISNYIYFEAIVKKQGITRFLRRFSKKKPLWNWGTIKAYLATKNFSEFIRHEQFIKNAPAGESMFSRLSENGELIVDFIGKLEHIDDDFKQICHKIRKPDLKLEKRNVSKKKGKINEFYKSQADLDHIYDLYRKDFDTFGYKRIVKF
jgi:hypothetical protein